uniref:Uncharacterized protein n=1 Tax=Physcomitrium patens TaxID=3218 RepID=A9TGW4_PHYPA|nr:hypothetical protein PHYPA_006077 [Physcomitrium patens]
MGFMHCYAESDNRRCGVTRKSSKWNWNLVKADIGHVISVAMNDPLRRYSSWSVEKLASVELAPNLLLHWGRRVTQKIRDPRFIYGKPNERDAIGVKEVIVHIETAPASYDHLYGPDFKEMNKLAAINNYCRSNEQRAARERFAIKIKPKHTLNTNWRLPSDANPNHRYGLSFPLYVILLTHHKEEKMSMPCDGDFNTLIGGGYQDEWIEMNEYFKSKYPDRYMESTAHLEIINDNKATKLQQQFVKNKLHPPPPKQRFILSRFQNVKKKIDNHNPIPLNRDPPYHKFYGMSRPSHTNPP